MHSTIAQELSISPKVVAFVLEALESGDSPSFIARYRSEQLEEIGAAQVVAIRELHGRLDTLEKHRTKVAQIVRDAESEPESILERVAAAHSIDELRDLVLAYEPHARSADDQAAELGLEPLASAMWEQIEEDPNALAESYVKEGSVADVDTALAGAAEIVARRIASSTEVRRQLRAVIFEHGELCGHAQRENLPPKVRALAKTRLAMATPMLSQVLAMHRAERHGLISISVETDPKHAAPILTGFAMRDRDTPWSKHLRLAAQLAWNRHLEPVLSTETRTRVIRAAWNEGLDAEVRRLTRTLLTPPLGAQPVLSLWPSVRGGVCHAIALGPTGDVEAAETLELTGDDTNAATERCVALATGRACIVIADGPSRRKVAQWLSSILPEDAPPRYIVERHGAEAYARSPIGQSDHPDLEPAKRATAFVGQRIQDPFTTLLKAAPEELISDPGLSGVDPGTLARRMADAVDEAVHRMGSEIHQPAVLAHIAGLGYKSAKTLSEALTGTPPEGLDAIPGVDASIHRRLAPLLRLRSSANPLDASLVHPEDYSIALQIAEAEGRDIGELLGQRPRVRTVEGIEPARAFRVIEAINAGSRDPRGPFDPVRAAPSPSRLDEIVPGMDLDGVVINVTPFGCFVDLGLPLNGLVHVSELSHTFVKAASELVHVGQRIVARVISIDLERRRVALSMKACLPRPRSSGTRRKPPRREQAPKDTRERRPRRQKGPPSARGPKTSRPRQPRQYTTPGPEGPFNGLDLSALKAQMEQADESGATSTDEE